MTTIEYKDRVTKKSGIIRVLENVSITKALKTLINHLRATDVKYTKSMDIRIKKG